MTAGAVTVQRLEVATSEYTRRIRAWIMYDWANSAFMTTVLGAVLPVYFSQVAASTLPSEAAATAYWALGLSISLIVIAILSPILGTVSDVVRGKKRMLAFFAAQGIFMTALLVLVDRGDWMLALVVFIFARIGFGSANVFYDSLLPHVAREEDRDSVSARGYAMGYLGGGLLLAANAAMIRFMPGTLGARLSFLSVAVWWAVFSIPILTRVPEPPGSGTGLRPGTNVIKVTFTQMGERVRNIRQYRELFKYLVAFLIYNDGIGTIMGVGIIYGAELGFASLELVLAVLLIQFVGIPFALIFGKLPNPAERRRAFYLAFITISLFVLPTAGTIFARVLPGDMTGAPLPSYSTTETAVGEGLYRADHTEVTRIGTWEMATIPAETLRTDVDALYSVTADAGARYEMPFNGQKVQVLYSTGPDHGLWAVQIDGVGVTNPDTGMPMLIDGYSPTARYGARTTFIADAPGEHVLSLINSGETNAASTGTIMAITSVEVLPPIRHSNLAVILGLLIAVQAACAAVAYLIGKPLFGRLAEKLTTKTSILLSLAVFLAIAIYGFTLNSVLEFWVLAWMVAIVLGGSQALSRSLYASMTPAAKSGEFFGLFSVMEKFSSIIGPAMFALAVALFGNSRPAILSLTVLFLIGGFLLTRVNVAEGRRVAQQEDRAAAIATA
jgi:MFS transporter, UMF1 family